MQTEEIRYKSADGLSLFAKIYGPNTAPLTVLCMHGLTRNHKDFEPMINALDGDYRFVAVDVRGRGQSAADPNPANYSPQVYAGDMAVLIDHLDLKEVALIGTSMGGLMAMIMMHMRPRHIVGTVLNDVGPAVEQTGLDRISAYVSDVGPLTSWEEAAAKTAKAQSDVFPSYQSEDWLAFAKRTYKPLPSGGVVLDYDPEIIRSVGEAKPSFRTRFALWRLFAKMSARPLLVVRGQTSDILSEKTALRMVRRHKNARLVTVAGVGHAPILDEPEAAAGVGAFLADLAPRSQA